MEIIDITPYGPLYTGPLSHGRLAETRSIITTAQQDEEVGHHVSVALAVPEYSRYSEGDVMVLQPHQAARLGLALLYAAGDAQGTEIADTILNVVENNNKEI